MRSTCFRATFTDSSCRLLTDPREVWIYYRLWQQGRRVTRPLGTARGQLGTGQWKPSSSLSSPLALRAVARVTPSTCCSECQGRCIAPFAGFAQSARHVDRLKLLGAAALAMSQGIYATQAMEGQEPPSSERPSTPQARVAQSHGMPRRTPTSPTCSPTGRRRHAWPARRWPPPGKWCLAHGLHSVFGPGA